MSDAAVERHGRVALVTGASAGLGRATALGFARDGYSVVVAGRREEHVTRVAEEARAVGAVTVAVPTDVRDPHSVDALFGTIDQTFGRLDVLFNNAGIAETPVQIDRLDRDTWTDVVATNVTGAFLCAQNAVRMFKSQNPRGGRIINNGSVSAHVPRVDMAAYTTSKHAITGLTKAIALEGRSWNIACGQIDIGNAQSEMADVLEQGVPQADGTVAVEPFMDAEDVVRAVLYMASLPLTSNVLSMVLLATKMPFVGRG